MLCHEDVLICQAYYFTKLYKVFCGLRVYLKSTYYNDTQVFCNPLYIQHMAHIIFEKQVQLILKFDLSGLVMPTDIMPILSSPHTLSHMYKLRMFYTIPEHTEDSPIYKYVVPV